MTFIVTYPCPRCHAALEARASESYTWLRCPRCGRAGLPPEHMRNPPEPPSPDEDVLVIGPASGDPEAMAGLPHPIVAPPNNGWRVLLSIGFLISLTMLVLAFLDQNVVRLMIFGAVTVVLFAMLAAARRRR